jgi:hypothetical protein
MLAQPASPECVDPAVVKTEPARFDSALYRAHAQPGIEKLSPRDDPVLSHGQRGNLTFTLRTSPASTFRTRR